MSKTESSIEKIAELICTLTRDCAIKEEFFASSFNLTPTEVRFLKFFSNEVSCSIKDLREKMDLTPGRITHILGSLEAKKLVARIPDANDKRNIIVKLLPKSTPLIKNLNENYKRLHMDLLKNIRKEDLEKIQHSLEILVGIFGKWVKEE